jgi:hypothetical protein
MINERDRVILTGDVPAARLIAGDVGVVVHVYADGAAYEVEFASLEGTTIAVETLERSEIRVAKAGDMPHARELAA